ncbi:hypothetical protein Mboo_2030 [Methanoregula boonei 6A8]|jgi:hypothetical protein|uniref:PEGA domain-containing protein n=1 Tax=Methanoregula boonei (strain DSM 21154 / JCM 14090 / 6A8) TaxID=456442 RepID=A7I9Y3_METB6|nr:hypothetical protein [Methanoregula boonei]ABS56544.1 hypothetical protein Mboo_2030 [Methanoregula boonei 6A8]
MKSTDPRCIVLLIVLLAAFAGTVSATNYVWIFVHPGSGTVCLDSSCQVNVGTLNGYSSTSFGAPACGTDHTIRVYNTAGYEDYTDTVYVAANCYDVTRSIYLSPIATETETEGSSTGTLHVYISPAPASTEVCLDKLTCQVNNGPAADTWSVQFDDVSGGQQHTLTVDADGYQPASQQVSATPGQVSTADISLVPVPAGTAPSATTASAPAAAGTTASPLGTEVVVLAAGVAGALAVFHKRR